MMKKNKLFWYLLTATFILFFLGIWNMPLYILDEAKNAECAREMWERGDLIVPTFNGALRTDKPPLAYFFMMLSYSIFGVSAFAARFFSAFAGILTVFSVFYYAKKSLGSSTAIWAGIILLSSLHFLFQFHLAVPDPYLIACITIAVFAFQRGLEKKSNSQLAIGYTATALGTLAKGPVALGLIGLILLLYLILTKQLNFSKLKKLRISLGAIWFCLLTIPWYVAVGKATGGEWLEGFFFTHNFNRFAEPMENHGGGFWMTLLYVFAGMLPFILFFPQTINLLINKWRNSTFENDLSRSFLLLCTLAVLVIVGFFAISTTKLPNYTVPAYPFLGILIAYYIHHLIEQKEARTSANYWSFGLWILLSTTLCIGLFIGTKFYEQLNDFAWLSLLFIPLFLSSIGSIILHAQEAKTRTAFQVVAIGSMLTAVGLFSIGLPRVFQQNPVYQSVEMLQDEENIITYKLFNPAYLFNLEKTLPNFRTKTTLIKELQKNPKSIILTQERYLKDLKKFPYELDTIFRQQDLFEIQESVILKLRILPKLE